MPGKATGIQLPTKEREVSLRYKEWSPEWPKCRMQREEPSESRKPCVETQVPTLRAWRSGTHDFLYYFFSYQRKYPSISTLLWRASICVLSTNHLLIQWDCEVGCCQHIHLPTKAICRGDAKLQCLEVNLLAFQDKHLFGYNYWNLNPKMGGKSRPR